jgi:hypothetical protein
LKGEGENFSPSPLLLRQKNQIKCIFYYLFSGLLISKKISISDCNSDTGVFFIADYRTMKSQKSIGAIIADSRQYFLQRFKISKKISKIFFLHIFFKGRKTILTINFVYQLGRGI